MESYPKPTTISNTQILSINCASNQMVKSNKNKASKWIAPSTHPYGTRMKDNANEISKLPSRKRTSADCITVASKVRRLSSVFDDTSASKSDSKVERKNLLESFSRENDIKMIMYFHKNLDLLTLKSKNWAYQQLEMKHCFGRSAVFLRKRFIDKILPNLYNYNCLSLEEIILFYDKADMVVPEEVRSIIQQKMLAVREIDKAAPATSEVVDTTLSRTEKLLRENKNTMAEVNKEKPNCDNTIRKKIATNTTLLKNCETSTENTKAEANKEKPNCDNTIRKKIATNTTLLKNCETNTENTIVETVHTRLNDQLDTISKKQAETHQSNEIIPDEICTLLETVLNEKSCETPETSAITNYNKTKKSVEISNDHSINKRLKSTNPLNIIRTLSVESEVASNLDVASISIAVNTPEIQVFKRESSDDGFSDDTVILETSSLGKKSAANTAGDIRECQVANRKTLVDASINTEKSPMKNKGTQLNHLGSDEIIDISCTESGPIVLKTIGLTHIFIDKENAAYDVEQAKDHYHTLESNVHFITAKEFEVLKMCVKYRKVINNVCTTVSAAIIEKSAANRNQPKTCNSQKFKNGGPTNSIKHLYRQFGTELNIVEYMTKDIRIQDYATQTTSTNIEHIESINDEICNNESISEKVMGENIPPDKNITSAKHNYSTEPQSANQLRQTPSPLTEQVNAEKTNEAIDNLELSPNIMNSVSDAGRNFENNQIKFSANRETVQQTVSSYKDTFSDFIKEINDSFNSPVKCVTSTPGRNNIDKTDSSHINIDKEVNKTVRKYSRNQIESAVSNYSCERLKFIRPKYTYSRKPKPPVCDEQNISQSHDNAHKLDLRPDWAQPSTSKSNDFIYVSDNSSNEILDFSPNTVIKNEQMDVNIPDPIFETLEDNDTKFNFTNITFSTISVPDSTSIQINDVISNFELSSVVSTISSTSKCDSDRNNENERLESQPAEEIKRELLNNNMEIKQELISGDDNDDSYSEMIFDREIVKEEISILESISNEIAEPNQNFPIAMSKKMKAHVEQNHSNIDHLKPIPQRNDSNKIIKEEAHKTETLFMQED